MNNKPYDIIADTRKMTHEDWLQMRKAGIGGSDCAAAIGLSRWKSPFQLWSEKTDRIIPTKAGEAAYWGIQLENLLRAEFIKRTNLEVHECPFFLRSKEHKHMLANIDGYVKNEDGSFSVLEIKTANAYAVQDWLDGLPIEYFAQIMHYMVVTGMSSAYVAVLLGGNEFRIQKYDRDEEMVKHIIQMEENFWFNFMLKDVPPEATAKDNEFLSQLYPKAAPERVIELPAEAMEILTDYEKANHELALVKEAKETAEAQLKAMMADAEVGVIGSHRISWKNVSTTRLDSKKVKALLSEDQLKECSNTTTTRKFTVSACKK